MEELFMSRSKRAGKERRKRRQQAADSRKQTADSTSSPVVWAPGKSPAHLLVTYTRVI
jgi:hypothetical protein